MPRWHCQWNNGLRKASPPQNLPFSLPGVFLPCADATQCFPEQSWGWVGAASARGLALPVQSWPQKGLSAPNTSHFHLQHAPLVCWRHTMLSRTTRRLGRGASAWQKGPAVACGKLKVGRSTWFLIVNLYYSKAIVVKSTIILGWNWSQTAKLRSNLYCTVPPSL